MVPANRARRNALLIDLALLKTRLSGSGRPTNGSVTKRSKVIGTDNASQSNTVARLPLCSERLRKGSPRALLKGAEEEVCFASRCSAYREYHVVTTIMNLGGPSTPNTTAERLGEAQRQKSSARLFRPVHQHDRWPTGFGLLAG
jgi:hypothetical protein